MTTARTFLPLAVLVVVHCLAACSSSDTTVGYDLPRLRDVTGLDIATSPLQGVVHVTERGCFTLDVVPSAGQVPEEGLWIVWPDEAVHDDKTVRLPGDLDFTEGSPLDGDGTVLTLDDLPEGSNENSRIGSYGRFCGADESRVVVLQHVRST